MTLNFSSAAISNSALCSSKPAMSSACTGVTGCSPSRSSSWCCPRFCRCRATTSPRAGPSERFAWPTGLFEDPTRLAGVRLFQQGDPLNRVHWRATARTGQLHSRVYENSRVAGASLLLDFHRAKLSRLRRRQFVRTRHHHRRGAGQRRVPPRPANRPRHQWS